jgi:disulfide bond formation protein DsbB
MSLPSPRLMAVIGAALAAAALGVAFASEWWGGLVPCALCLWERWPYRVAIAVGVVAAVLPRGAVKPLLGVLALTFLVAAGLAAIHSGVELRWWKSPLPECAAPVFTGGSVAERLKAMPLLPSKPCDDPTYLVPFLPVSMAQMNLLFSLGLAGLVALTVVKGPKSA